MVFGMISKIRSMTARLMLIGIIGVQDNNVDDDRVDPELGLAMKYLVTIPDDIISGRWCSWWRYWSAEDNNWKSNQGANCDMANSIRGQILIHHLTTDKFWPGSRGPSDLQVHQGPHFDLQHGSSKCQSPTVNDTNREWQKLITHEFGFLFDNMFFFITIIFSAKNALCVVWKNPMRYN